MQDPNGLCGVILAAGESSRMGTDKAMLPWPPPAPGAEPGRYTLLTAAILAFEPHTRAVVVVAGKNADSIATVVGAFGAYMVRNPDPSRGQFSSLQIGLSSVLDHNCDSAMITPVDCPSLALASLTLLRESFQRALARDMWAVAPENSGKHGHPLLVSHNFIRRFLDAPVTSSAREIIHAHADRIEYVPVPDDLSRTGMNTPEEYASYAEDSPTST
ncbi:MAG: NTP transferase domain-containing protein [Terracidiphilus sp.]